MFDDIILIAPTALMIFVLVASVVTTLIHSDNSKQRNVYLTMLAIWIVLLSASYARSYNICLIQRLPFPVGFLNGITLAGGVVALVTFIHFGNVIVLPKRYQLRATLIAIGPMVLLDVIYLVFCAVTGGSVTTMYNSYDDFVDRSSVAEIIIRALLFLVQLASIAFVSYNAYTLVPIYNKYIEETQSNDRYSVTWFYSYIFAAVAISCVYFLSAFYYCKFTYLLYPTVVSVVFYILNENVNSHKLLPDLDLLNLTWTIKRGWHIRDSVPRRSKSSDKSLQAYVERLTKWILHDKVYTHVDLSLRDLLERYKSIDREELLVALESEGLTFQSYIRRIRIDVAVEILTAKGITHFRDIYSQVGFSHYSSFSRAFTAVKGCSPTEYIQRQNK